MARHNSFIETVDQIVTDGVQRGILHLFTDDSNIDGNIIPLSGKKVVNFGSCSYLGLEFDERLKTGAKDAIDIYGTQFSESRAYVSTYPYKLLEELLCRVFDAHVIVTPTTTLGHIATIPVLVGDNDCVLLDHQVHSSVQTAANLLKARGIRVELLRHNRLDILEERYLELKNKYAKVWYMADGVYSMYGDVSPVKDIVQLLDKYEGLFYYVDDAHGMSTFGKNGRGYVLNQIDKIHPQMVMGTSLNKAFASGGGVIVFPNKEWARKVRTCGSTLITSGPMQPSGLGAAIASARIHLSNEIYELQEELKDNIRFANLMIEKHDLPLIKSSDTPVFFIGVGLPKVGYNLIKRMLNEGYYLNLGVFPAVPMKNTGIRFTITTLHTFTQIEDMIAALAYHLPKALEEEQYSLEKIYESFKLLTPEKREELKLNDSILSRSELIIEHYDSIKKVNKTEWDELMKSKGTFDWDGLQFLEDSFSGNVLPEDNWSFDYLIIREKSGRIVAATFFTVTLSKDDMLAPQAVSGIVEQRRKTEDAYYLTSRVVMMGSLMTEGGHLYLDSSSAYWKEAMNILFEKVSMIQEYHEASMVILRDFEMTNDVMDRLFIDNGFVKVSMPDNHSVSSEWTDFESHIERISLNSRRNIRKEVLRHADCFEVQIVKNASDGQIAHWYSLYQNVKKSKLEINTFPLPYKVFENVTKSKNWEIIELKLKPEFDNREDRKPVGVVFNYISGDTYNAVFIGLDYSFKDEYRPYSQAIYRTMLRANELKMKHVKLGFTCSTEKKKFGAEVSSPFAYIQTKDNYNMQVIASVSVLQESM